MRSYEKTHSFISFALNLAQARTSLWLLLGEAQSKVQHLAGVPMLPEVEKEFMKVYLAKGVCGQGPDPDSFGPKTLNHLSYQQPSIAIPPRPG